MTDPPGPSGGAATATLVLAGHGSLLSAASAAALDGHADALRDRGLRVRTAFWKQQPTLSRVLDDVDRACVVPVLTSEGYFAGRVFPRELGVAERAGVAYTDPVGTHPAMTDVLAARADRAVADCAAAAASVGVAVVGHGTERDADSGRATREHARRLRERGRYAEVRPLFLDQDPAVADLRTRLDARTVVAVPFFVADGHHATDDVPAAIGLPDGYEPGDGPVDLDDRRVAYTPAAGTAPELAEVVLERAADRGFDPADFRRDAAAGGGRSAGDSRRRPDDAGAAFASWVEAGGRRTVGELAVAVTDGTGAGSGSGPADRSCTGGDVGFELRHRADREAPAASLDDLAGPAALRDRTAFDDAGRFRPLRAARSLPTGWRLGGLDRAGLALAVRLVYPGALAHRYRERSGDLDPTDLGALAGRQTGIYADVAAVDDADLAAAVDACCGDCTRRREWDADGADTLAAGRDGDVPCPEACPLVLEALRTFDGLAPDAASAGVPGESGDHEKPGDPEAVPVGALDRPGNRYRRRFLAARRERESASDGPTPAVEVGR